MQNLLSEKVLSVEIENVGNEELWQIYNILLPSYLESVEIALSDDILKVYEKLFKMIELMKKVKILHSGKLF